MAPTRLAIGLLRGGTPVNDPAAKVHLRFFNLDEQNTQVKFEADARYFGQGLPAGFYVAYPTFDTAGNWGIEVQTQLPGQDQPSASRLRLEVKPESVVPNVGQQALAVKTATIADTPEDQLVGDADQPGHVSAQPRPGAEIGQADGPAVRHACLLRHRHLRAKPTGDGRLAEDLWRQDELYPCRGLQIPVWRVGHDGRVSAPMAAWGLKSEPWLYLIDAKGTIAARFEGGITQEEMGPALEKLIAGEAVVVGSCAETTAGSGSPARPLR